MVRINLGKITNPKTKKSKIAIYEDGAGTWIGVIFGTIIGIGSGVLSGVLLKRTYEAGITDGATNASEIDRETMRDLDLIEKEDP